ncbi:hypothetical protein ABPG74_002137 [Tetrahymena malaccensis]
MQYIMHFKYFFLLISNNQKQVGFKLNRFVIFYKQLQFKKKHKINKSKLILRNHHTINNNQKMRIQICLLLALVLCATFTNAQSSSQKATPLTPISLKGANGYPVKCYPIKNECGCWTCSQGYLLQCVYDKLKSGC